MSPCVVLAEKLGAMLPSRNRGCSSVAVASPRARKREVEGREELIEEFRAFQDRGAERVKKEAMVARYAAQYSR